MLVNNAIYTGPAAMVRFVELTAEQLDAPGCRPTWSAQVVVIKAVLPVMPGGLGGRSST